MPQVRNHPNIAHIHGLEESGGVRALVMELVEGEDLSQRIARGAVPLDEALPMAKQIAKALEAAHEQGIIHRDLKPANIKVRPDGTGTRVALDIRDLENDIWIWDLAHNGPLTRLTDSHAIDWYPVWTPDSRPIIFGSQRAGASNLYWQAADNTGPVAGLTTSPSLQQPISISPDGTRLIVRETAPKTGQHLRVLRMDGSSAPGAGDSAAIGTGPRQTEPLMQTTVTEDNGEVSPDGHYLAYESNEGGQFYISVRPFPNYDSGHWTISPSVGTKPLWARSGTELFYLDGANAMISVPVHTTPTFSYGNPGKLFDGRYYTNVYGRTYDVSLDGQKFLMIKANAGGDQTSTSPSMVVVLNWVEELKARVPTK